MRGRSFAAGVAEPEYTGQRAFQSGAVHGGHEDRVPGLRLRGDLFGAACDVMLLADFAAALAEIDAASSRNRMVALLAELFRADPDDAGILPYLLQGRLGPPYASPDLGLDEKRVAQALADVAGVPLEMVTELNAKLGDLGLAAEKLLAPRSDAVTVRETYETLLVIARTAGSGSAERKLAVFRELLARTGGLSARYLARIALGRLRLGVADATILDALSVVTSGGVRLRPAIEHAYALCSDLGLVARTLVDAGPDGLASIQPEPGRPVLSALAERLPSPEAIVEKLGTVVVEPKYDGLRLQAQRDGEKAWLFTRRLEDVSAAFPEIAAALLDQVSARRAILDGEAVGYDPATGRLLPFQETTSRRRKHGIAQAAESRPLRYFVFDLLDVDGEDLMPLPLAERLRRLRAILRIEPGATIQLTPEVETRDPGELERLLDEAVDQGLEGIMVKRPDAPYHAGSRQYHWIKLKPEYRQGRVDTFDLVIVGYDLGRGRRTGLGIGSLLCAVVDRADDTYRTVTRVGSGLSDGDWVQLRELLDSARSPVKPPRVESLITPDVWVEPRYVVEVVAAEVTRSPLHTCGKVDGEPGYALRFPRVVRLRLDRRPEDAATQAEIIQAYQRQTERASSKRA